MRRPKSGDQHGSRGIVLVLVAVLMVFLVGMVAFAIDLGYVVMVRTELQRSADSSALASASALVNRVELSQHDSNVEKKTSALEAAKKYAALNTAGSKILALREEDVTIGYVAQSTYPLIIQPNTTQFPNAVLVHLRRDATSNGAVRLFFGNVLGVRDMPITVNATAYFATSIKGFSVTSHSLTPTSDLLPYAMSAADWDAAFIAGQDFYTHDPVKHQVRAGGDGIREVMLLPLSTGGGSGATTGNFGTLDLGGSGQSTGDLTRQILYGPNAADFSHFPNGQIKIGTNGVVVINGDTGISAGVKEDLNAIVGKNRILPLYSKVVGNGANAQFTIVRFVGVTIIDVKLNGSLAEKHILIQPSFCIDPNAIEGGSDGETSSFVRRPIRLVE